ncbi:MAG: glycosyltransferase [Prevotella sp.]|nr:glycosyltransferase [Prevotella sp.]
MKIVLVHNAVLPVKRYGGTERIVWALGRELSRMGHQVTFMLRKGSSCSFARLIEINPSKSIGSQVPEDVDIVHFQDTAFPADLHKPYVVTINGNKDFDDIPQNAIFVSRNHAERYGHQSFVYNGLDWDEYGPADLSRQRKGFHFLGKAAWRVKNIRGAIRIAERVKGATLEVMGGYRLNLKMGFRFTLNPRIHFHGMVNNLQKKKIIEQSYGLIFPVLWHEPFGLCLTESLYYGAPVFGTPMGSLPEIISKDVGFLSYDEDTIVEHLKALPAYSSKLCHDYAVENFNSRLMAENYLLKYEQVLNGNTLA